MLILILSFAVFLVVGVPIAYALGLASLLYLLIEQPSLAVVVPQRVFSGMNNYALEHRKNNRPNGVVCGVRPIGMA